MNRRLLTYLIHIAIFTLLPALIATAQTGSTSVIAKLFKSPDNATTQVTAFANNKSLNLSAFGSRLSEATADASYAIVMDANGQTTIQVTGAGATVSLIDIYTGLANANLGFLQDTGNGVWQLNANLFIGPGVILNLSPVTDVSELRLRSQSSLAGQIDYASFVYLRTHDGTINLDGIRVYSWDTAANTFDFDYSNGRAYIVAKHNAVLNISNAELSYLGSADSESYGVTWRDANDPLNPTQLRTRVTGQVLNSQFHHNYSGIYTSQASNMGFQSNVFQSNVLYGFVALGFSHHFTVENNLIYNNGAHGFISRGGNNFIIRNNILNNNSGHGIYLTDGASQNTLQYNSIHTNLGYGIEANGPQTVGNTWSQNLIYANQGGGISLTDGANVGLAAPVLLNVVGRAVSGQTSPNVTVEIFADTTNQAQYFEGQTVAAQDGRFSLTIAGNWQAANLTAIIIDSAGNTSVFSPPIPSQQSTCYTLTTSVSPGNGGSVTTTPSPNCQGNKYTQGTVVSLSATVNSGYGFSQWIGATNSNANPLVVTIDGNKSITANFTLVVSTNTPTSTPTAPGTATSVSPTNTPSSTPVPTEQGETWQTENSTGAYGRRASLALDSAGNPHFSYHYEGARFGNLRYAHRTANGWVTEIPDNDYEAGLGSTSLALDGADYPHIIYQYQGGDFRPEYLKYAYRTANGWIKETIGSDTYGSPLALDKAGNPHITYSALGGAKYAHQTENGWISEPIDSAGSSLVLDANDNPHIGYIASGEVKYAYRTASGWIIETVDAAGSSIATTSGQKVALALDKTGNPYITYNFVSESKNDLKYAYRTTNGWVTETVDSATNLHSVGWDSSIAVDSAGHPRISYDRIDLGVVKYAWRTENSWSTEVVATFGLNTYSETSLVLDNADNPHMIYYQGGGLIYAYKKGQGINSISGQVTGSGNCTDKVTITTNTGTSALTHSDGKYTISGLAAGTHTLTALKSGCTFTSPVPVTVPPDAFDQNFTGTLIRPLPVVLVHGWNDTAASWNTYIHEFLPSIGLTTRYAVDSIDTGAGGHTPASIDENAKRLQGYIERVKRETGATQVNIVAHSMGGLITRRYIKEYMNADTPDVNQLIMLGTPNKGLNLARALELSGIPGLWPTTKELTESFIDNFNAANPVPDNVRFYAIAGNYYCLNKFPFISNPNEEQPNDIAVSRKSVFAIPEQGRWTFPDKQTAGCGGDHRGMRSKEPFDGGKDIFDLYVGPLLLEQMPVIPSEPQTFAAQQTAKGQTDQLQGDSNDLDTLQFTTVQTSTLQPGGRLEFSQIPESATTVSFIVIGQPEQMIVSLRDPSGQVIASNTTNPNVQYMQMDAGFMPITSYTISNPVPGIWTTIIEANAQTPSTGVGVAALGSLVSNLRLTLPVFESARVIHQTVNVTAKLHKGDTPLIGANVNAQFVSPDGRVTSITLLDDGLHGDSSAGDGLYGYQFTPMAPGVYSALIRAEGMNNNVTFQRRDVWAVQVDGNQVFLPLVLR